MRSALAFLCVAFLGLERVPPCACGQSGFRGWRDRLKHVNACEPAA